MLQPTNGRYYSRRRGLTFSLQSPSLYKKTQNKGHTRVPQKGCRKQSINTPPEHRECISRYIISDSKTNLKSTFPRLLLALSAHRCRHSKWRYERKAHHTNVPDEKRQTPF